MMTFYKHAVATIIADPEKSPLNEAELNSVVDALQASGAIIEDVKWLSDARAVDIFFAVMPVDEAYYMLANLLENVPFDYYVQSPSERKKSLIISDMDSTMIEQECIDELADFAGIKPQISEITERAMNGELDFKEALRARVALLKGLSEDVLQQAFDDKITFHKGAEELIGTMGENGAARILVSGGFTFFTERVSKHLGFEISEANTLEIKNGLLTGKVKEPILDSQTKLDALNYHSEKNGLSPSQTLAIGDGANDLPMILAAANAGGLGVAFHAKPSVAAEALKAGGFIINHTDLKSALYVQGYTA